MSDPFVSREWHLAHGRKIRLGPKGILMGILNVTPDSFSDGGRFDSVSAAIRQAEQMISEGAQIIDVGGESTRPGADPVSADQEQDRVLPVIGALAKLDQVQRGRVSISIDTYRADTAMKAIRTGADIINDVWGFQKDENISKVAAETGAGCVIMHTGRERSRNRDVITDQMDFLEKSISIARSAGVANQNIVLDPGFGFAKEPGENIELLAYFEALHVLGFPLLAGTSRKRFIGHFTGQDADFRDIGTAATTVVARMKGSALFRVHDVASNRDALAIADAVLSASGRTA